MRGLRALTVLAACILCACSQVRTVVEVREHYVHDTTQVVDSVWRDRVQYVMQRGDTVYKTDSVIFCKYKIQERVQVVTSVDSIPYPVEVVREVRVRSGYDKFVSWGFWLLISALILALGWRIAKAYFLRK